MNKIKFTLSAFLVGAAMVASSQTYTFKQSAPTSRHGMAAAVILEPVATESQSINPTIYVFGGSAGAQAFSIVEAYDVVADTWATKAPMPIPIVEGFAGAVGGKIYVIGGFMTASLASNGIVQEYDPATDTWTVKSSMAVPRSQFSGAVINGKIYVVGGWPGEYSDLEIYDPATDTWTAGANLPYGILQNNSGVNYLDEMYLIGGKNYTGSNIFTDVSKYDPVNDSWSLKSPLPGTRFAGAAVYYNGKIHYFGGTTNNAWTNNVNTHFLYDPVQDSWTTGTPMPISLVNHVAVEVLNKVYIIGGFSGTSTYTNVVIEYSETPVSVSDVDNELANTNAYIAYGALYVRSDKPVTQITMHDITGKVVLQTSPDPSGINLSGFPAGIYTVRLMTDKGIKTTKVIL